MLEGRVRVRNSSVRLPVSASERWEKLVDGSPHLWNTLVKQADYTDATAGMQFHSRRFLAVSDNSARIKLFFCIFI